MPTKSIKIQVSPAIGKVSGKCIIPPAPKSVLVLAHGAGAGMEHSFMEALASRLAERGIATVRYNFPFTENKKGRPDSPVIAHLAVKAAIAKTQELFPKIPLFVAGKSFGGRMSSQYLSANHEPLVSGIIFYGFPLHPAGKPSTERAAHLQELRLPMLFLQGTKDALATINLVEAVVKPLRLATLVKLEGADHSFKAGKTDTLSWLAEETSKWTEKIIARKNS